MTQNYASKRRGKGISARGNQGQQRKKTFQT